jgi:hypothetical protein
MNRENVLALADFIEAHIELPFSMDSIYMPEPITMHSCGSPGCIGSFGKRMYGVKHGMMLQDVMMEMLDIDEQTAAAIVYPDTRDRDITRAQAVRLLRNLAATGEVDWDYVMGRAEL